MDLCLGEKLTALGQTFLLYELTREDVVDQTLSSQPCSRKTLCRGCHFVCLTAVCVCKWYDKYQRQRYLTSGRDPRAKTCCSAILSFELLTSDSQELKTERQERKLWGTKWKKERDKDGCKKKV